MGKKITYGYARVSTSAQHDDRQRLAMVEFGVEENFIFTDKQSGKDFDRPAYQELMGLLGAGDTLVVKSLDRLGRNYYEVLEQWRIITKEKGAFIVILDLPLLDTREKRVGDLTGTLISDIVLQLFSYVAQTEREMNHQRTIEGIAAAKAKGTQFGRPPLEKPKNFEVIINEWKKGNISENAAAKKLNVLRPTFHKWAHE
ncbi:MAG: recombinase family protein [Selenomonadaceae bacterium]|nr:recombinase family protein [Selenomonadaceae bacterium]